MRDRNDASFSSISKGDVDAGLAEADHVVTSRYVADGSHAAPIEPRAVVAQWEGNKVTIWTSTQVPFDARAGVCETLGLPANRVRIIVPHLGGGFGGKCGFHYEAHIAALARAAKRPVRLVFSRREEFLAPDRRREGMVIDITTGVRNDGTITARKAWIADRQRCLHRRQRVLPTAGGDARRRAVSHPQPACRSPPRLHQPSAVRLGPGTNGAPVVLGDRVAHRRGRRRARHGSRGLPPAQRRRHRRRRPQRADLRRDRCAAVHRGSDEDGRLRTEPLPDDEAIGVAIGWWPSFAVPSGAYIKLDGDGSGQIITGAQECGTGSVMTLRQLAADELGMEPEDFQLIYQDTSVAPYDMGATGSQTLFNNGRAVVAAAGQIAEQLKALAAEHLEASPADIVLADGHAHVAGTPSSTVSITELAGIAAGGELLIAHGSGTPPSAPPLAGSSCVGDVGMASFVAPQFSCHAVRIRLDRDTGVVRVLEVGAAHDSGTIINETGALGQIQGGVMMGIGQALTEGTRLRRPVAPAQRGAARVQAADLRRLAGHQHPLRADRHPRCRSSRRQGIGRGTQRGDGGGDLQRAGEAARQTRAPPADDRRTSLGDDRGGRRIMNFTIATTVDEALAALAAGARPVAGGSDLVVGARQGKAAAARLSRRHRSHHVARRHRRVGRTVCRSARSSPMPVSRPTPRSSAATRRWPMPARSSDRRRLATSERSVAT